MKVPILIAVLTLSWSAAIAQVSALPEHIQAALQEMGQNWNQDRGKKIAETRELFSELHRSVPKGDVQVISDVSYGPNALQEFDLYKTDGTKNAPILVFMHGGAYVRGARNSTPETSSNIARFFAGNGLLALNIDYRLAPAAPVSVKLSKSK